MYLSGWSQKIQIDHPLGIGSQDDLPRVTALRDMVRNINSNYTS